MLNYKIELYIGYNDKDTHKLEYPIETMENTVCDVILSSGLGCFTLEHTKGIYKHLNGEIVKEFGCKVTLFKKEKDWVKVLCTIEELKEALNQEAILYSIDTVECDLI